MRSFAPTLRYHLPRRAQAKSRSVTAASDWKGLGRRFGDLKVRPKLMVLHNLFFLILAGTIYFALYREIPARAQNSLVIVLGAIYILAVVVLETTIMPLYVYRPLHLMLDADKATQDDDHEHELIAAREISGDEIGQIMRSRNETILQLRQHEADLEDALRRLEAQDRLVHLGLMSASVAHELNTPLSVLLGSIEKLTECTTEPLALDRLARMLRVTQRIKKISEGLVDFSRTRKHEMEAVPMQPLIAEAWGLVAFDEKSSDVQFTNIVDTADIVTGNPDRLMQVFVNLLRNALYAVHQNGKIVARSRHFSRNGQKWISISVDDDGPGIPPDVLPNIFEAFVSSRLDARGTGLGLTVAEGIIDQHGGTISASNRAAGGACLEVTLPACVSGVKEKIR